MKKTFFRLVTVIAVLAMALSSVSTALAQDPVEIDTSSLVFDSVKESPNGIYIVQTVEDPVVGYKGDITGYAATAPEEGEKIDPNSGAVKEYVKFLTDKHTELIKVTGGEKLYDYSYAFNGFAAKLTKEQANKLAMQKGVLLVSPDEIQTMDTSSTPSFLGLDAAGGLWSELGGPEDAGEDIIIGMIDSGIWPESLSFTDKVDGSGDPAATGTVVYDPPVDWFGDCDWGEEFTPAMCNNKLIGAQYFNAAWGGNAGIDASRPWEFNSVRDYNGHGTHTSSTSGGNHGVLATGPTEAFGEISGMAPRARIAMYKALWSTIDGSTASGANSDLVAAIDQAVADGVDVISYSISGTQTNFLDPVEIAFLWAADAGIFVATSAGNSGPTVSTVAHPSPWITTVAASTHNRNSVGSVTTGDGVTSYGVALVTAPVTAPFIEASAAALPGADPAQVRLCYSSLDGPVVLDPAIVAGKIVLCDRGTTARVNKSFAVFEAGGVGMVLVNPTSATLNADFHSVPSVHLQNTYYAAIHAYAALPGATATINASTLDFSTPAPYIASFSSRGPLKAGNGDLLKPDVTAPGVDILASVSPSVGGLNYALYQGTSMSTPHVAGVAALLMQDHPDWTPSMVKSALMTSAYDVLDGTATDPSTIFKQGAGHIQPNSADDPGLTFYSDLYDWAAFLCGFSSYFTQGSCDYLTGIGYSTDINDLNTPSIAIGALAGSETVSRYVYSVGNEDETYTSAVTGLAGLTVTVSPASFTISPDDWEYMDITITNVTAALNAYVGGYITWTGDKGHVVRIPVVVKPVAMAAPAELYSEGDPIDYDVSFGFTGDFTATPRGLVPAVVEIDEIYTDEMLGYGYEVPAGTTYIRAALFDEYVDPASDLDLYLIACDASWACSTVVAYSGNGGSTEEVNYVNPPAGNYAVFVEGYDTADPSTFSLFTWILGTADEGNIHVSAPAAATLGDLGAIELTFSDLVGGIKYLGSVAYSGTAGLPNPTIVRVDAPFIGPVIESIDPSIRLAGTDGFTLTVEGLNFEDGDEVYWDALALPTTFVSSTKLEAEVPAAGVTKVDEVAITVVRPGFESMPSNAVPFYVHTFGDVLPEHPLWTYVEGFFAKGITTGCAINPLRYCPDRAVTRAEMAVFILRALHADDASPYVPADIIPSIFSDVPVAGKEWMEPWIEQFYNIGLTTGCAASPLRYCPERGVTRAEMVVFLLRAKFGDSYVPANISPNPFADVPVAGKEWMEPWIEQFYALGYTNGCGAKSDGSLLFCPDRGANRAEMATFIVRVFEFPELPELELITNVNQ